MDNLAFSQNGFFHDEFERIFVSHFGSLDVYARIVELLAEKAQGLSRTEIQDMLDLPAGGELTRNLENLESAGFITAFSPFDHPGSVRLARFMLCDPFMRFYFEFLRPYKKRAVYRQHYFTNSILPSPRFRSWLGRAFELLCLEHKDRIARILEFSGIEYSAGPWFRQGKRGVLEGVQLDLVFERADDVLTVCEIKYRTAPVGVEVMQEMEEKLARTQFLEKRTVQRVLVTKSEASRELVRAGYFSRIVRADELMGV